MAPKKVVLDEETVQVKPRVKRTVKKQPQKQKVQEQLDTSMGQTLVAWGVVLMICFWVFWPSAFVAFFQWLGWNGATNFIFIGAMIWLFIFDIKHHSYSKAWYPTLGMLGTFVGIFIGLLGFDVTELDKSLPILLGGLKTAFITSIVGVVLSGVRAFVARWHWGRIEEKSEVDYLSDMNNNFDTFFTQIGGAFGAQLQQGLANALGTLNENITNAFTQSIDNFTESVDNLTNQINNMNNIQTKYNENIEKLSTVSESLGNLLSNINTAMENLEEPLENFTNTGTAMSNAAENMTSAATTLQNLDQQYQNAASKFSNDLEFAAGAMIAIVQTLRTNFKDASDGMKEVAEEMNKVAPSIKKYVDDSIAKVSGKKKDK